MKWEVLYVEHHVNHAIPMCDVLTTEVERLKGISFQAGTLTGLRSAIHREYARKRVRR